MRIGVVPMLDRSWGGIYQYSVTLLSALAINGRDDEIIVLTEHGAELPQELAHLPYSIVTFPVEPGAVRSAGRALAHRMPSWLVPLARGVLGVVRRGAGRGEAAPGAEFDAAVPVVEKLGLDFMLYAMEHHLAYRAGVPYAVAIHDLQHRLQPDLPEFADARDMTEREARIRDSVAGATLVLVDSQVGKEDLLDCYADTGIAADAVAPLPFVPAYYAEAEASEVATAELLHDLRLPERYLFYPAQFWPHKNHERIVRALVKLAGEGIAIDLVLAGTHAGPLRERTFREVIRIAEEGGIADRLHYLGYVPDESMPALYAGAAALVMPTFFGPTNIPVLEAFHFGCPVITSDIRGIREQVGDAAVLVDPTSVDAIADGIRAVIGDDDLRETLVRRGRERSAAYTVVDFAERLGAILAEAEHRIGATAPRADARGE